VRIGQAVEGGPGRVVLRERLREVGGHLDLARPRVGLDADIDLVAGGDAGRCPVLRAQRDEKPPAHPRDRRPVGVTGDGHPHRGPFARAQRRHHVLRHLYPGRGLAAQFYRRAEFHAVEYSIRGQSGLVRSAAMTAAAKAPGSSSGEK